MHAWDIVGYKYARAGSQNRKARIRCASAIQWQGQTDVLVLQYEQEPNGVCCGWVCEVNTCLSGTIACHKGAATPAARPPTPTGKKACVNRCPASCTSTCSAHVHVLHVHVLGVGCWFKACVREWSARSPQKHGCVRHPWHVFAASAVTWQAAHARWCQQQTERTIARRQCVDDG